MGVMDGQGYFYVMGGDVPSYNPSSANDVLSPHHRNSLPPTPHCLYLAHLNLPLCCCPPPFPVCLRCGAPRSASMSPASWRRSVG